MLYIGRIAFPIHVLLTVAKLQTLKKTTIFDMIICVKSCKTIYKNSWFLNYNKPWLINSFLTLPERVTFSLKIDKHTNFTKSEL